jgi:hypothetical protein
METGMLHPSNRCLETKKSCGDSKKRREANSRKWIRRKINRVRGARVRGGKGGKNRFQENIRKREPIKIKNQ